MWSVCLCMSGVVVGGGGWWVVTVTPYDPQWTWWFSVGRQRICHTTPPPALICNRCACCRPYCTMHDFKHVRLVPVLPLCPCQHFSFVEVAKPPASRSESPEVYLVCKGFGLVE
jgi:hypothetical protein